MATRHRVVELPGEGRFLVGAARHPDVDAVLFADEARHVRPAGRHAERRPPEAALASEGRPNCTFTLEKVDEEHLGAFLQLMEFETAFMGELLGIDAFDQEGVELGKKFTYALMGRKGWDEFSERFTAYESKRG
ncbi:MAG: hypothetical protein IBJ17_20615 [Reyranella sp.]|nr:hypothetical protein [Reyranella sp.]